MTTKVQGKDLIVEYTPASGPMISIATKSRNFKVSEKGERKDVSVREDILANNRDYISVAPERTYTLAGLDTDVNAPDWIGVEVGDIGTLKWYRRSNTTGRPSKQQSVTCTSRDFNSPHDDVNDWSIEWAGAGAVSSGVES